MKTEKKDHLEGKEMMNAKRDKVMLRAKMTEVVTLYIIMSLKKEI